MILRARTLNQEIREMFYENCRCAGVVDGEGIFISVHVNRFIRIPCCAGIIAIFIACCRGVDRILLVGILEGGLTKRKLRNNIPLISYFFPCG